MKKIFAIVCVVLFGLACLFFTSTLHNSSVMAEQALSGDNYVIYTIDGTYLFEKQDACVGDEYIDSNMNCYVIVEIDEQTKTGKAKFVKKYTLPKVVKKSDDVIKASTNLYRGNVGLYLTHNDESYITGDGYDSIYGAGGVHDVAKTLAISLQAKNISVRLDETLHIPHDTNAYARSSSTAQKLLNGGADAIFDIHRDATSRAFYVTKVGEEEFCKIRMVVGKANANYEQNKAFALFLMSVARTYCPWLFVDIYMAKGHYNQGLSNYAMLFECGSHLVEKPLVLKTMPYLAEVLNIALFGELVAVSPEENNEQREEEKPIDNAENKQMKTGEEIIQNNTDEDNGQNNLQISNKEDNSFVSINNQVAQNTNGATACLFMFILLIFVCSFARIKIKKGTKRK